MSVFRCIGLSSDGRTNVWALTLPCGHEAKPVTTLFSEQLVSCPKCAHEYWVNYNDKTMKEQRP